MTNFEETLSAAVDGECSSVEFDRLLDACGRSPQLMRRYGRHCASREARIGTAFNFDSEALCVAVMSQIDPPRHPHVVALRSRARAVMRPLGGLALAASLGALVTFTAYRFDALPSQVTAMPATLTQSASNTGTTTIGATPVADVHVVSAGGNGTAAVIAPTNEVQWSQLNPGAARQLDDYMMEHASYRSAQSMGSTLSYARMAAQGMVQGVQSPAVDGSR